MASSSNNNGVDLGSKYVKLDQREHVLHRPGMYIGSIEQDICETWVYEPTSQKMVKKPITYIPGLLKIFDEILVNAIDHSVRLKTFKATDNDVQLMKHIKVVMNKETGVIEVLNDGDGIEVVVHPEHKIYIPQLIFGNLLTSSNYNDNEERTIGGTNGVGGKVTSIYSEYFEIETVDRVRKLLYTQRFEKNMTITHPPKITKCTKKPYTCIRFKPEYERFKLTHLTDDMYDLFTKRVFDACAVTDNDISIYLNDVKLDYKNFEKYVDLYIGAKSEHTRVYEQVNDRWEIIASYNNFNGFDQVSFVNGIWTIRGGKHVEYILNQIVKRLSEMIAKKNKNTNIKPQNIKDNLILFIKSTIVNPTFDSQSKETLTTPFSKFGSKAELSDKFIEKLYKTGIVDKILEICEHNNNKDLAKTDGKKKSVIKGIPKLDDANWAGTAKSKECTLILTEGDSAKTMVIAGLSQVGRDKYGVFPLKGKLMNVKDTNVKKIMDNEEITNLKKIIGLETNKKYVSVDDLRYGKIMLCTDQDNDGTHIRGLLFNLFHTLWPSLFQMENFLISMLTPIVKVTHNKKKNETFSFYCLTDYENWKKQQEETNTFKDWKIKYYKGLGTSTNDEAKQYFKDLKIVTYKYDKDSDFCLELAFNKSKADDRKLWLSEYDRNDILDYTNTEVKYEEFINRELIHFSNYDLERSIPSMVDGFKVSQRKVLYGCFKKNLVENEMRVAQLASYVSENACYHHGEASLQGAITAMAQNFVGSNNINLLRPNGQYGTRVHGGRDAGAPRYIYTLLEKVSLIIFNKQDHAILKYMDDDGIAVEPEYYVPIIPMILVNGALGIGTGFSTNIPSFNPKDITNILKQLLQVDDEEVMEPVEIKPWYMGFTGTIEKHNDKYVSRGRFQKLSATKLEVNELPIGTWTQDFKELLESMLDKDLKQYESYYTDKKISFILHFSNSDTLNSYMTIDNNGFTKFENDFKLVSSKMLGMTNMYLYNSQGQIQKYDTPFDIIRDFYNVRLSFYTKRKEYLCKQLEDDMKILENKMRFIKSVVSEELQVSKFKKIELEEHLRRNDYLCVNDCFDYLLRIPIYNLTIDKVEELEKEYNNIKHSHENIMGQSEKQMWLDELVSFEKTYAAFLMEYSDAHNTEATVSTLKPKRRQPSKK
jgi:DNA topoisomerase-2